jgi:alpha-1,6-mannosyltransferase
MKIVHIANFYGPRSGGIKTTLHELGRGYLKAGHEFFYIVPGPSYIKEETIFGIKITLPGIQLVGTGGYQIIKSNKQLLNIVEYINPDRIEVSDRFTLFKLGRWAKKRRIPSLVFSHETLSGLANKYLKFIPRYVRQLLVDWHNKKLANTFDTVIATTDFAAAEFKKIGIKNLRQVSLGVDLDEFNPINRSLELRSELLNGSRYLLVHCARLSPEKEPIRSIQAVEKLLAAGIDVRLIIIGGGPLWKKIRKLSANLPIQMIGYVACRKKIAQYLAVADVSIAPGPLETFCLSALESLSSGTPVVASASSAVGEILNINGEQPAGAVAEDTGEAFASAITEILRDSRIRKNARLQAEKFDWSRTVSLMLQIHLAPNPPVVAQQQLTAA